MCACVCVYVVQMQVGRIVIKYIVEVDVQLGFQDARGLAVF